LFRFRINSVTKTTGRISVAQDDVTQANADVHPCTERNLNPWTLENLYLLAVISTHLYLQRCTSLLYFQDVF